MIQLFWIVVPLAITGLATVMWQSPTFYIEVVTRWVLRATVVLMVLGLVWNQALSVVFGKLISSNDAVIIEQIQAARLSAEVPGIWWAGLVLFCIYNLLLLAMAHAKIKHDSKKV
ncbi:MAG: hypothetical protein ACLGJE_18205 [Gammaproteobacteria bacterium]